MSARYLLDTDTCIDLLRGVAAVCASADRVSPDECAVSTVTTYELLTGVGKCRKPLDERRKVERLLATVHELPFGRQAAEHAAEIRAALEERGVPIGPYDVMIAGVALTEGSTLVTANTREFGRIRALSLANWREPG